MIYVRYDPSIAPFVSGGKHCTTEPINITDAVREALERDVKAQKLDASSQSDKSEPPVEEGTTKEDASKTSNTAQTVAEETTNSEKPDETKDSQQREKI